MTRDEANEIVLMVDRHWTTPAWTAEQMLAMAGQLEDLDYETALVATGQLSLVESRRPSIALIREHVRLVRATQPKPAEEVPEGDRYGSPPRWARAWLVARHHANHGVLAEQRAGYDQMQEDFPFQRVYVWSEQELMPADQRERFLAMSDELTTTQIGELLAGLMA